MESGSAPLIAFARTVRPSTAVVQSVGHPAMRHLRPIPKPPRWAPRCAPPATYRSMPCCPPPSLCINLYLARVAAYLAGLSCGLCSVDMLGRNTGSLAAVRYLRAS